MTDSRLLQTWKVVEEFLYDTSKKRYGIGIRRQAGRNIKSPEVKM
jgi:hypothetical protein